MPNTKRKNLQREVRQNVEPGATVYTDALLSYRGLSDTYIHEVIDHAIEYVKGNIHTNNVENFWSLLKRSLKGTYISVEAAHLAAYVNEQVFRYNQRGDSDHGRFTAVLSSVFAKRLT